MPDKYGIKGGINFADLHTKNSDKSKVLVGYNIGGFAKLPIYKMVAIQPEIYYTTKGAEVTYNNLIAQGTAQFTLNYVEIPLLLIVNLNENFNVYAGPYASALVSGKVKNKSNTVLFDYEHNIKRENYNDYDLGIIVGGGVDIGRIGIGGRYCYGTKTVGKQKDFCGFSRDFSRFKKWST
ncbi:MAG: PorT family protein [Bacteroidetes bacterium]|nr:PorT family protein [Bacteroidota bacterium]